jgi:hypothetical protein
VEDFVEVENVVFVQDQADQRHFFMRPLEMASLQTYVVDIVEKCCAVGRMESWQNDHVTETARKIQ